MDNKLRSLREDLDNVIAAIQPGALQGPLVTRLFKLHAEVLQASIDQVGRGNDLLKALICMMDELRVILNDITP